MMRWMAWSLHLASWTDVMMQIAEDGITAFGTKGDAHAQYSEQSTTVCPAKQAK